MGIKQLIPLFLPYLMLCAWPAIAEDDTVKEMVCLTTHYPPYTIYREKQRDFVGRDMHYLNQLASRLNWHLTVLNFPWGRVKLEIEKDQYNCIFSLAYNQRRSEFLDYTAHPLHVTQYAVFYAKQHAQIQQKNLAGKVVAVLRGIPLDEHVLNKYGLGQATIIYLDSNETLLEILTTGRVDASVLNDEVGRFLLERSSFKHNIDSFVVSEFELPVYLAFRKGTVDMPVIDATLTQIMLEESHVKP
ncbi:MAG: transporter substrate-binding domain-containing protein [Paraglaciecola sp.]|nr:transporter substrate-binding domain-containing protein [Paraglaciecola sp.]